MGTNKGVPPILRLLPKAREQTGTQAQTRKGYNNMIHPLCCCFVATPILSVSSFLCIEGKLFMFLGGTWPFTSNISLPLTPFLQPSSHDSLLQVVYAARNPKDVTVSYYNMLNKLSIAETSSEFDNFARGIMDDNCEYRGCHARQIKLSGGLRWGQGRWGEGRLGEGMFDQVRIVKWGEVRWGAARWEKVMLGMIWSEILFFLLALVR